jgi:hypothetical protein
MKRFAWLAAAVLFAACATWRWSGSPPRDGSPTDVLHPAPPDAPGPEVEAPRPAAAHPRTKVASLPDPTTVKLETAMFSSDLAPDELDISEYPVQQRYNYRIYSQACSRCHDLSRSLYAPHTTGAWLDFYLMSMRVRGRLKGRAFTTEELNAVRDFLRYDTKTRKKTKQFEAQTERLRERFNATVDARIEKLQKSSPAGRR